MLWASTSTKNPAYPDTLYVEELIGPDTVNTMPEETIEAYQDHGDPEPRLLAGTRGGRAGVRGARRAPASTTTIVTETLEREGVEKFAESFDSLIGALREKWQALAPA